LEKTYQITGIEPMLYKNFKAACAYYELTINEVFIKHMENIVEDHRRALGVFDKPKTYTKKGAKKK